MLSCRRDWADDGQQRGPSLTHAPGPAKPVAVKIQFAIHFCKLRRAARKETLEAAYGVRPMRAL